MREYIDQYVEILKGILFIYEQEHGKVKPNPTQVSMRLKQAILDGRSEKIIQSHINYLHKVNRVDELKSIMLELSHEFENLDNFF